MSVAVTTVTLAGACARVCECSAAPTTSGISPKRASSPEAAAGGSDGWPAAPEAPARSSGINNKRILRCNEPTCVNRASGHTVLLSANPTRVETARGEQVGTVPEYFPGLLTLPPA